MRSAPTLRRAGSLDSAVQHIGRCARYWVVFDPQTSQWLDKWDFLVLLVLLEVTYVTPYELAFLDVKLGYLFFINRVIDVFFLADMTLKFFTAVPDSNKRGCWIKDPKRIAYSYFTTWFWPDLLGLLPVDVYILFATESKNSNLKAIRLARTLRLVRVTKGLRLLHRWRTTMGLRNWFVSIVGLMYSLSVCCHWAACLWAYVGMSAMDENEEHSWLGLLKKNKNIHGQYDGNEAVYTLSLYWAIYTMAGIGYGDIAPVTPWEYKTALLCMVVMAGLYALVIAEVCAITSTFSVHEVNFKRTMDDLNWLLSDWKVDSEVRVKLRTYFNESRDLQRAQMQKSILEQMSPKLQGEVLNSLHRPWADKVMFLRAVPAEALVMVVQRLQAMLFAPDELILGDRTLYVVRRGVAVHLGKVMVSGTSWGEDLVLHNRWLRKREPARALCYLHVNGLHYSDLMHVAEAHPFLKRRVQSAARIIGVHRSVVHISKVIKGLRFHGMVDDVVSKGVIERLTEASLCGDIDGDLEMNPGQRPRVQMLLREGAEIDEEENSDFGLEDVHEAFASCGSPAQAMLAAGIRGEAEDIIAAYTTRLESILGCSAGSAGAGGSLRARRRAIRATSASSTSYRYIQSLDSAQQEEEGEEEEDYGNSPVGSMKVLPLRGSLGFAGGAGGRASGSE